MRKEKQGHLAPRAVLEPVVVQEVPVVMVLWDYLAQQGQLATPVHQEAVERLVVLVVQEVPVVMV